MALRRPIATIVLMLAVGVVGLFGYSQLPVNLLPDITYPLVKVYVNWRGATPEEIEDNVADVIERRMATVDGLDYLDSQCTEGLYALSINFDFSVDRDVAYQDVLAKMGLVRKQLPADAEEPMVFKADPSQLPVVDLAISSSSMDQVALRTWVENSLQDHFTTVAGTAGTEVTGGQVREIRVLLDPERLQGCGLSLNQVTQRLREENLELLGGRVTSTRKEFLARTMGRFRSVGEINEVTLGRNADGSPIFLRDVATVKDSHRVQRVITKLNGQEGVKLSIFKQADANTIEVEEGIQRKMKEIAALIPPDVKMGIVYDQADYIRASVSSVRDAALIAALLVILVTAFFLTGWQRVLNVAITLPLSLLATFFVMQLAGFSLNIFSLGGLVVAITVLLDNCVVVLENITRLQTEHPEEPHPVRRGATEVAGAVFAATLTFVALFLPFLLVSGLTSLLFRELILTVAVVIIASLVVALTVTPMLSARFYPEGTPVRESGGRIARLSEAVMRATTRAYRPAREWALRRRAVVIGVTLALFGVGFFLLTRLGSELLPEAEDGLVMVKVKMPTGTSVAETHRVLQRVEQVVKEQPGVDRYFTLAGGWVWGLVTYETAEQGEVNVQLVPRSHRSFTTPQFVERLTPIIQKEARVPGARIKVMHAKMKGIRTTGTSDVEAEIRAPRSAALEDLAQVAAAAAGRVKDVPGVTNLDVSLDISKPEYRIYVDRARAADLGMSVSAVANTVRGLVDGAVATAYQEAGYYYDIRAVMNEDEISTRQDLENLVLYSPQGGTVRLRDVARVERSVGPLQIDRIDQMRVIKATADAMGRSVGEVSADAARALKGLEMPAGYQLRMGAQAQMMRENFRSLGVILLMALFFAYVILAIQFESFTVPFVILIRVPLSLIGLSAALYATQTPLGVMVMIGIVILAGIEINHGVVLLSFVEELRGEGMGARDALRRAGAVRLRPILMTALVGIIGLLPLALGLGEGTELLKPMAIAVIGGLTFSVFLTLFFLPALYLAIAGGQRDSGPAPEAAPAPVSAGATDIR